MYLIVLYLLKYCYLLKIDFMSSLCIFNMSTVSKIFIANISFILYIFFYLNAVFWWRKVRNFIEYNSSISSFIAIAVSCFFKIFTYHKDMKNYTCYLIETVFIFLIFHPFSTIQLNWFLCEVKDRVESLFFFLYWYWVNSSLFTEKTLFPQCFMMKLWL